MLEIASLFIKVYIYARAVFLSVQSSKQIEIYSVPFYDAKVSTVCF